MKAEFLSIFLIVLVLGTALSCSCKKEESPAEKRGEAYNPYAVDTILFEAKKKVEERPEDSDAWFRLADLYERNGQYTEAIDAYKKVSGLKPEQGYVYLKIGTLYDRLGQPGEAVEMLKKAVHHMPGYAVAYNNLGIAYGKLGKNSEEISALKKAIQLRPSYVTARYNLGITYLRVKDRKAALQQYQALKNIATGAAEDLRKEIEGSSSKAAGTK
ncbi:MAG: tetratricopeptide repeat protein [Nitrospirae bacterium]|nr:tetratricopeptide repeat protein [Nitrospirota bacterium]